MRPSRLLGIAVGESRALVAELSANDGKPSSSGPGSLSILREKRSPTLNRSAKRSAHSCAIVGIRLAPRSSAFQANGCSPSVSKRPAADKDLVADSLRLQAEGEFAADGTGIRLRLRRRIQHQLRAKRPADGVSTAADRRIKTVMEAAKVKPISVMPSASAISVGGKDSRVLMFGPGGAEFVGSHAGEPRVVRYLGPISSPPAFLAGELRRASAAIGNGRATSVSLKSGQASIARPRGNYSSGTTSAAFFLPAAIESLGQTLGSPVKVGDVRTLGVTLNGSATTDADKYAGRFRWRWRESNRRAGSAPHSRSIFSTRAWRRPSKCA